MNANLEHYRIFYYAGKYGSITQAAEERAISQPAVSQALKAAGAYTDNSTFYPHGQGRAFSRLRRESSSVLPWPVSEYIAGERGREADADAEPVHW